MLNMKYELSVEFFKKEINEWVNKCIYSLIQKQQGTNRQVICTQFYKAFQFEADEMAYLYQK